MAFMLVAEDVSAEPLEVPCEPDGSVLVSTIAAQFAGAIGLKYRNAKTNILRAVRLSDGRFYAPEGGWGATVYMVVLSRTEVNKGTRGKPTLIQANCSQQKSADKSSEPDAETLLRREIANALQHFDQIGDPYVEYAAGMLHAVACDNDAQKRTILSEMRVTAALMRCAVRANRPETLVSLLRPLSVLTAHSNENKRQLLEVDGALDLMLNTLKLCRVDKDESNANVYVLAGELAGVVLRNVSSVVALDEVHRSRLRAAGCFDLLLSHLRASSLRVVANAAGTLWNLTAKHAADQQRFIELGAVPVLRSLTASRHRAIAAASRAALKNLSNSIRVARNEPDLEAGSCKFIGVGTRDDSMVQQHDSSSNSAAIGCNSYGSLLRRRRERDEKVESERSERIAETCDHLDDAVASASASSSVSDSDDEDSTAIHGNALIEIESAVRNGLLGTMASVPNPVINQAATLLQSHSVNVDVTSNDPFPESSDDSLNDEVGNRVIMCGSNADQDTEVDAPSDAEEYANRFLAPDSNSIAADGDFLARALGELNLELDSAVDDIDQAAIDACIASASVPFVQTNSPARPYSMRMGMQSDQFDMLTNDEYRPRAKSYLKSPTEPKPARAGIQPSHTSDSLSRLQPAASPYKIELVSFDNADNDLTGSTVQLGSPTGELVRVFALDALAFDESFQCASSQSAFDHQASPLVRNGTFSIRRECSRESQRQADNDDTFSISSDDSESNVVSSASAAAVTDFATTPDIIREHSFGKVTPDDDASNSNPGANSGINMGTMPRRATITVLSSLASVNSERSGGESARIGTRSPSLISLGLSLPEESSSPTLPPPIPLAFPQKLPTDGAQNEPLNRRDTNVPTTTAAKTNQNANSSRSVKTPRTNRYPTLPRAAERSQPQTQPQPQSQQGTKVAKKVTPKTPIAFTKRTDYKQSTPRTSLAPASASNKTVSSRKVVAKAQSAKNVSVAAKPAPQVGAKPAVTAAGTATAAAKGAALMRSSAKPKAGHHAPGRPSTAVASGADGRSQTTTTTTAANSGYDQSVTSSAAVGTAKLISDDSIHSLEKLSFAGQREEAKPSDAAIPTICTKNTIFDCAVDLELASSLSSSNNSLTDDIMLFAKKQPPSAVSTTSARKQQNPSFTSSLQRRQVRNAGNAPLKKMSKSPSASTATNGRKTAPAPPARSSKPSNGNCTAGCQVDKASAVNEIVSAQNATESELTAGSSGRAASCPSSPRLTVAASRVFTESAQVKADLQGQAQSSCIATDDACQKDAVALPATSTTLTNRPVSGKRTSVVDRLAALFRPKARHRSPASASMRIVSRKDENLTSSDALRPKSATVINRSTSQPSDEKMSSIASQPAGRTPQSFSSNMPFSGNVSLSQRQIDMPISEGDLWITREDVLSTNADTVRIALATANTSCGSEAGTVKVSSHQFQRAGESVDTKRRNGSRSQPRSHTRTAPTQHRQDEMLIGCSQRPDVLPYGQSDDTRRHDIMNSEQKNSCVLTR